MVKHFIYPTWFFFIAFFFIITSCKKNCQNEIDDSFYFLDSLESLLQLKDVESNLSLNARLTRVNDTLEYLKNKKHLISNAFMHTEYNSDDLSLGDTIWVYLMLNTILEKDECNAKLFLESDTFILPFISKFNHFDVIFAPIDTGFKSLQVEISYKQKKYLTNRDIQVLPKL